MFSVPKALENLAERLRKKTKTDPPEFQEAIVYAAPCPSVAFLSPFDVASTPLQHNTHDTHNAQLGEGWRETRESGASGGDLLAANAFPLQFPHNCSKRTSCKAAVMILGL